MGLLGRKKQRGFIARCMRGLMLALLAWCAMTLAVICLFKVVNPPLWSWRVFRMFDAPARLQQVQHEWVPIAEIPKSLQLAVIASEDQRFPLHNGVDFHEISNALADAAQGERLRGASTLTQQTAKNLFLWPGRDWARKGLELPLALSLDAIWGKERVLEVYLNIVEFGPGVYGAAAASEYWFHKPVSRLNAVEAARLASILPNPWEYKAAPAGRYVSRHAAWTLQQMDQLGYGWLKFDK